MMSRIVLSLTFLLCMAGCAPGIAYTQGAPYFGSWSDYDGVEGGGYALPYYGYGPWYSHSVYGPYRRYGVTSHRYEAPYQSLYGARYGTRDAHHGPVYGGGSYHAPSVRGAAPSGRRR